MTTQYSGNYANVSNNLIRSISGCANNGAGKIRVTTTVAHLYSTNNIVIVSLVLGTIEANGTWAITVIDSTHFDLVGSTFTNAYTGSGTVSDRSLTPAGTLPSDGEQATVAVIVAALQTLFDRTQYLAAIQVFSSQIIVPPTAFNISRAADWIIGDATTEARVVKAVPNDNALIVELTPFLVGAAGRRLASVSTTFAVGQSHPNVPAFLPVMRLLRTQSLTAIGLAPSAPTSLLAAGTEYFPTPGSGAAYYASGNLQAWTLTTDQNNVIDATRRYYVALTDENGADSLPNNIYFGMQLTLN